MGKAIAPLFTRLGATLTNSRWSWGAVRCDGVVFLRVWQDEIRRNNEIFCCRITKHARFKDDPKANGYWERLAQIELVRNGSRCFLVMCEAKDITAAPREIKDYNGDEVFEAGEVVEIDGDLWIEMGARRPVREVAI